MTITVYGREKGCPQCDATKRKLTKQGNDFNFVDVDTNSDALEHIIGLGYQQVPVVEIKRTKKKDETFSGYRPDLLAGLKGTK